jgi:hypothetical protein
MGNAARSGGRTGSTAQPWSAAIGSLQPAGVASSHPADDGVVVVAAAAPAARQLCGAGALTLTSQPASSLAPAALTPTLAHGELPGQW